MNIASKQLNMPFVCPSDDGRMVSLYVELGRMFRTKDVVIRLKNREKLVITAQRQEDNARHTLSAYVMRVFQLPERVYPESLNAGLSQDGILSLTALVDDKEDLDNNKMTLSITTSDPWIKQCEREWICFTNDCVKWLNVENIGIFTIGWGMLFPPAKIKSLELGRGDCQVHWPHPRILDVYYWKLHLFSKAHTNVAQTVQDHNKNQQRVYSSPGIFSNKEKIGQ